MNKAKTQKKASREIGQLSESLEDYLEIIFTLAEKHRVARVKEIALAKKVKMSSVTSALKRLDKLELVSYEAREFVSLTPSGDDLARRILKRHNFLAGFLVEVLGVESKTAAKDACSMEHALSQATMSKLYDFSEFLQSQQNGVKDLLQRFARKAEEK
jgi:DtxR family Mn-dependent transcriptional regulator